MLQKLMISAGTGAVAISSILIYNDFNPFKNQHWLLTAALIATLGTLVAELANRKNPQAELKK
ncbi:MAG: hypothetical protein ACM37W_00280 [Actinomycetota bacterium]